MMSASDSVNHEEQPQKMRQRTAQPAFGVHALACAGIVSFLHGSAQPEYPEGWTPNDDTHMGTIERQYDRDFAVRDDMQLGNFLKREGIKSLNDLIHSQRGKR
jgi:hypothetical protein